MLRLGLLGGGAIGNDVIDMVDSQFSDRIKIPAVLVQRPRGRHCNKNSLITHKPAEFFSINYDTILEVAGHSAVKQFAEKILNSGTNLLVTSVGAFTDDTLYYNCIRQAENSGAKLVIPSAGIGALDTLSAAAVGGLDSVQMIIRKDPKAWYGTHAEQLFDLANLTQPTIIFEGNPREGATIYPQNVNISAAVSLAGLGLDKTKLTIIAATHLKTHICEIRAKGAFGSFSFREDLAVSESNPKTGKIVAMAVMKTIKQMVSPVTIGA